MKLNVYELIAMQLIHIQVCVCAYMKESLHTPIELALTSHDKVRAADMKCMSCRLDYKTTIHS